MRVPTTKLQNSFGKYLKLVLEGTEVIVTKNGRGVAKINKYCDPKIGIIQEGTAEYIADKYMTYDDFQKITENSEGRYELIDGKIYLLASPNHSHQKTVQEISVQMYNFFSDKPCANYTAPYDVKLSNDAECFENDPNVVQPDILVICDHDKIDENDRYQGTPTLIVEVLSESTRSKDMVKKLNLYMMSGVSEYWMVDPKIKRLLSIVFLIGVSKN